MDYFTVALCSVVCLALSLGTIAMTIARANRGGVTRQKCFHQTHAEQVPRFGGLGIVIAYLICATWYFLAKQDISTSTYVNIVLGPVMMFGIGFLDDFRPLGAKLKLGLQILIASAIASNGFAIEQISNPFGSGSIQLGGFAVVAGVVWLVALTNLINIIDGIDGLAAGISLMLMVLLIAVGIPLLDGVTIPIAVIASGAIIGFLYYNFPPAKVYMGDGGAYFLGCLIGVLTLHSSQKGTVVAALIAPIFALGLPIIDVGLTLIRRALKGLPLFRADRRHLHHRLIEKGFSHRRSVLTLYLFSLMFLLMALGVFWSNGKLVPIFAGLLFMGVIFLVHSFGYVSQRYSLRSMWRELSVVRKETRYIMALGQWLELEAERCDSPEELWENFQFLAQKLKLYEVRLSVEEGEMVWRNPSRYGQPLGDLVRRRVPINSGSVHGLDIVCEESLNPPKVFEMKAELVTEAWVKAANRWSQHQRQEIRFSSESIQVKNVAVTAGSQVSSVSSV